MKKREKKGRMYIGTAPGTLIQSTNKSLPPARITYFEYSEDYLDERQLESLSQVLPLENANRSVWPLREVVNRLEKFESTLIHNATKPYLADVYDHTIQIIDTVETIRDITSGLLDIYLSNISNSMNSVMKVLTIIATIFIPLTFIAGVYGMNFQNMPELSWAWGYPVVVSVMVMAAVGMLFYFKRKKWL